MKKLISVLVAVVLSCSVATSAFAEKESEWKSSDFSVSTYNQDLYNQIKHEVENEFAHDEQFALQTKEYGDKYSQTMIDHIFAE